MADLTPEEFAKEFADWVVYQADQPGFPLGSTQRQRIHDRAKKALIAFRNTVFEEAAAIADKETSKRSIIAPGSSWDKCARNLATEIRKLKVKTC